MFAGISHYQGPADVDDDDYYYLFYHHYDYYYHDVDDAG